MAREPNVWWNAQKGAWCSDVGGKRRLLAKGKEHKKHAREQLRAILAEQELLAKVNGQITVAALAERFLDAAQADLAKRTYESYQYACQKFVDAYGDRYAHTIKVLDIDTFSALLKDKVGDTSRAIILRSIRRLFNWGAEKELIPPHGWRKLTIPVSGQRDRYLSDAEFRRLLQATNPGNHHRTGAYFRRLLMALDWTLCRPGELCRLQWDHIHWDHDVALMSEHKTKKTGKPKIIVLVPKMKRLLRWLQARAKSLYCFVNAHGNPWTIRTLNHRMSRLCNRAGIQGVMPYTMRHRAATNALLNTGDLKSTSALLGHASTKTTERYLHLCQQHLVDFATRATGGRRGA